MKRQKKYVHRSQGQGLRITVTIREIVMAALMICLAIWVLSSELKTVDMTDKLVEMVNQVSERDEVIMEVSDLLVRERVRNHTSRIALDEMSRALDSKLVDFDAELMQEQIDSFRAVLSTLQRVPESERPIVPDSDEYDGYSIQNASFAGDCHMTDLHYGPLPFGGFAH